MTETLIEMIGNHPFLVLTVAVFALILVSCLVVTALRQGRELSLWPPRIGSKPTSHNASRPKQISPQKQSRTHGSSVLETHSIDSQGTKLASVKLSSSVIGTLFIISGPDKGMLYFMTEATRSVTIGRDVSCEVSLKYSVLSRKHCTIQVNLVDSPGSSIREYTFSFIDSSTNDSWVNRKRICNCELRNGDVIQIGGTRIAFLLGDHFTNRGC